MSVPLSSISKCWGSAGFSPWSSPSTPLPRQSQPVSVYADLSWICNSFPDLSPELQWPVFLVHKQPPLGHLPDQLSSVNLLLPQRAPALVKAAPSFQWLGHNSWILYSKYTQNSAAFHHLHCYCLYPSHHHLAWINAIAIRFIAPDSSLGPKWSALHIVARGANMQIASGHYSAQNRPMASVCSSDGLTRSPSPLPHLSPTLPPVPPTHPGCSLSTPGTLPPGDSASALPESPLIFLVQSLSSFRTLLSCIFLGRLPFTTLRLQPAFELQHT